MKKLFLGVALFGSLGAVCVGGSVNSSPKNAAALTNEDIYKAVSSFFNSYYEIDTRCEIPYQISGYQYDIYATIVDKVSEDSRYNQYLLQYTVGGQSSVRALGTGEFFYSADDDGYAVEEYISIENEIVSRSITNTDGEQVEFLGNYNSPFYNLAVKKASEISSYFEISTAETGYFLSLNDAGYDLLEESFNNFFNQFTYKYVANFDAKTHRRSIKNVTLSLDADGTPTSMAFNRVESDFYGAVVEGYSSTFVALDSVPELGVVESSLTEEQAEYFDTQIASLNKNAFATGNFTQTTVINDYVPNSDYTALVKEEYTYHNYYDASNKIMLSDYEANDSTYGLTYIGTYYYSESYGSDYAYTILGISPEQGFYGALSTSYPAFDSVSEFAPTLSVSHAFFSYSESDSKKTYTFDISSFNYDDYYFSLDLLESVLGQTDPCVIIGSFVADSSYNFDFQSLVYEFDADGNLSITLNYNGYYGYACSFVTTFSDIGTTDINAVAESNSAVKDCLSLLSSSN